MKKYYRAFLLFLVSFGIAQYAHAAVTISEIMYDPDGADTNREWIELYNDGSSSVDLASWKFVEADTNHGLTSYSGGTSIDAGGYAIIALDPGTFSGEWSAGGNALFDSSFSLVNSGGEALSLKDGAGNIVYTVSYDPTLGGNDDGNSLQKYNGAWVAADPTPAAANSNADTEGGNEETGGGETTGDDDDTGDDTNDDSDDTSNDTNSSSSTASTEAPERVVVNDEWKITLTAPAYGIVGSPSTFATEVENLYGEHVRPGTYVWNMGDGTTMTTKEGSVTYTYEYPGDYVIMLDYWRTGGLEKEMTVRHTFSVKEGTITIKGISQTSGLLDVELHNGTGSEIDLSGYSIRTPARFYDIPAQTILLGNKSLFFTGLRTGFVASEGSDLLLVGPDNSIVSTNAPTPAPVVTRSASSSSTRSRSSASGTSTSSPSLAPEALAADASSAARGSSSSLFAVLAGALVLLGIGSVLYMKRGKREKEEKDSFEVTLVK